MNGVLGHFYALSRLNWAGDNLGYIHLGGSSDIEHIVTKNTLLESHSMCEDLWGTDSLS